MPWRRSGRPRGKPCPPWLAACATPTCACGTGAALALGFIGPEAHGAAADLIAALKDRHRFFFRVVRRSLEQIGGAAVAALTEALTDTDSIVRCGAAHVLDLMQRDARANAPTGIEVEIVPEVGRSLDPTPLLANL